MNLVPLLILALLQALLLGAIMGWLVGNRPKKSTYEQRSFYLDLSFHCIWISLLVTFLFNSLLAVGGWYKPFIECQNIITIEEIEEESDAL